ncbi:MAG: nickel-dependent lactate racemase [Anaerolineae bacterium]|nr:nickel-dependent lactate racemase [Anaerolineae bacterium]
MATIELAFKPHVTAQVTIDDRNLLFYATHRKPAAIPDPAQVIAGALQNPIGTSRLDALLSPHDRVVIVVDDVTRPTPAASILPFILDQIARAGIPDEAVLFFMGLGTHRPMTGHELRAKLGDDVLARFKIVNREYRDGDFVDLGRTESGTPVEIDRQILDADFKITIGNVVPHATAGWGGGSKMILPGVCSSNTSDRMHLMACVSQPVMEVLGVRDNKARAEMDAVAAKVGLDFIVNTVLDEDKNILGLFAGHFVDAHRAACEMAEEVMVVPIPALADILIASANPCHVDYWQGIKGFAYGQKAVREGGVFILLLDGAEGLCGDAPSHEETVRKYLSWSFEAQKAAVERGEVHDLVGLNVPMYHAMLRHRVARTICVTNHMARSDLDALGFEAAPSVQAALARAYEIAGSDARVGVIPFGGETLTRVAPDRV